MEHAILGLMTGKTSQIRKLAIQPSDDDVVKKVNELVEAANRVKSEIEAKFPIGSLYINAADDTNPYELLGFGTWEAFAEGRVLVGLDDGNAAFDTIGETGGVETVTLTGAQSGIAAHLHTSGTITAVSNGAHTHTPSDGNYFLTNTGGAANTSVAAGNYTTSNIVTSTSSNGAHTHTTTGNTGTVSAADAASSHTNLQPYVVVYMWQRTA